MHHFCRGCFWWLTNLLPEVLWFFCCENFRGRIAPKKFHTWSTTGNFSQDIQRFEWFFCGPGLKFLASGWECVSLTHLEPNVVGFWWVQWEGITVRRGVWGMFILGNPGYILTTRPFELILRCEWCNKLDVNNFLLRTLVLLLWVMSCLFTSLYSSKSPCEELWNNPNISGSQECVWVTPKKKKNNFSLDLLVQNLRHTKERSFRFCWVYIIRILFYQRLYHFKNNF